MQQVHGARKARAGRRDLTEGAHSKVFVGGLSFATTSVSLCDYFAAFGKVVDAVVMVDPVSSRPRGFGFVLFDRPAAARAALAARTHVIDGRKVRFVGDAGVDPPAIRDSSS